MISTLATVFQVGVLITDVVPQRTPASSKGLAHNRITRRTLCSGAASAMTALVSHRMPVSAMESLDLDDLPPKAQEAYRQYWPDMQLAGDYYVFELLDLLKEPGRWDIIATLTESTR